MAKKEGHSFDYISGRQETVEHKHCNPPRLLKRGSVCPGLEPRSGEGGYRGVRVTQYARMLVVVGHEKRHRKLSAGCRRHGRVQRNVLLENCLVRGGAF